MIANHIIGGRRESGALFNLCALTVWVERWTYRVERFTARLLAAVPAFLFILALAGAGCVWWVYASTGITPWS